MAALYIVASPIGNLKDITIRALEVLRHVDIVACEDTRRTLKLLNTNDIKKPLISCHSYSEKNASSRICGYLEKGESVAYVSEAGTPGVSDPGSLLSTKVREQGFAVIPVPGPSAVTTLMSVGAPVGKAVTFAGFLSPKQGRRRRRLAELLGREEAFVLYESPHRIAALLKDLIDLDPDRKLLLGREMTKLHEEYLEGRASELALKMNEPNRLRGEITLLVGARKNI